MTHIDPSFFDSFANRGDPEDAAYWRERCEMSEKILSDVLRGRSLARGPFERAVALDEWRWQEAKRLVEFSQHVPGEIVMSWASEYRRLVRENITPETGEA